MVLQPLWARGATQIRSHLSAFYMIQNHEQLLLYAPRLSVQHQRAINPNEVTALCALPSTLLSCWAQSLLHFQYLCFSGCNKSQ